MPRSLRHHASQGCSRAASGAGSDGGGSRACEHRVVLGPGDVGRMRQHQPDGEAERIALAAETLERRAGLVGDVHVLQLVRALARPRGLEAGAPRVVGEVQRTHVVARDPGPVGAVVADAAFDVAVKLIRSHRVQPPAQDRAVAGGARGVQPGGAVGGEEIVVGPAILRRRDAGRSASTSGSARRSATGSRRCRRRFPRAPGGRGSASRPARRRSSRRRGARAGPRG